MFGRPTPTKQTRWPSSSRAAATIIISDLLKSRLRSSAPPRRGRRHVRGRPATSDRAGSPWDETADRGSVEATGCSVIGMEALGRSHRCHPSGRMDERQRNRADTGRWPRRRAREGRSALDVGRIWTGWASARPVGRRGGHLRSSSVGPVVDGAGRRRLRGLSDASRSAPSFSRYAARPSRSYTQSRSQAWTAASSRVIGSQSR